MDWQAIGVLFGSKGPEAPIIGALCVIILAQWRVILKMQDSFMDQLFGQQKIMFEQQQVAIQQAHNNSRAIGVVEKVAQGVQQEG